MLSKIILLFFATFAVEQVAGQNYGEVPSIYDPTRASTVAYIEWAKQWNDYWAWVAAWNQFNSESQRSALEAQYDYLKGTGVFGNMGSPNTDAPTSQANMNTQAPVYKKAENYINAR